MKVYAKQVPWEYQEAPLFLGDEFWPDNIIVTGNDRCNGRTTDAWDRLANVEDAADELRYLADGDSWASYNTATEALNDLLTRDDGKGYNTRQVHAWKKLLKNWQDTDREKALALELITGIAYDWCRITGTCQGECQTLFHPADWTREAVRTFEMEYFNNGTEWIIHDGNTVPEGPEDVNGYSCYCHAWNIDDTRKELAEIAGCNPEDLALWEYTGMVSSPSWSVAV